MHAKAKSLFFLSAFMVSVIAACGISPVVTGDIYTSSISPAVFDPRNSALEQWFGNFDSITQGFTDAGINGTHVYYGTANTTGVVQHDINIDEDNSLVFQTNNIEAYFSRWYDNYSAFNASMGDAKATPSLVYYDFTGVSESWTDQAWKENLTLEAFAIKAEIESLTLNASNFGTFLTNIEANFASVNPVLFGLPGLSIGTSWANATPEETFIVLNAWIVPRNTFWVSQFMYRVDNGVSIISTFTIQDVLKHALGVMEPAKIELTTHSSLAINYSAFVDATITLNVNDKAVNVVWDNDDSIRNFLEALNDGKRPSTKLFTGDEILYLVHFTKVVTTVTGDMNIQSSWKYENNANATNLKAALRSIMRNPNAAQLIGEAAGIPAPWLRSMLFASNISVTGGSRTYTDSTFKMGQLKVNAFDFDWRPATGIQPTRVDLWYAEHTMVGLFAFEDINGNGVQDLEIRGNSPFLYPVSNESRYKYRISSVQNIDYMVPVLEDNQLAFGINFTGIQGALVPFDISDDSLLFNNNISDSLPENVSSIGFKFRFGVDETSREGKMKVDYKFANFTNNPSGSVDPALNGLSLSMITMFEATRFQYGQRIVANTQLATGNGSVIDPTANQSRQVGSIRFASGSSLNSRVFQMDLDSIPYQLGETDHVAIGQLIPVRTGYIVYGRSTPVGNSTFQQGVAITNVVMLYSVNFPTWNGEAIVHDPVFSTFIPMDDPSRPWFWIIFGITLGGVSALVVISIVMRSRKHAVSHPGMPRSVPGEAKVGAGSSKASLNHSFFFPFKKDDGSGEIVQNKLDPYDPATFDFFAAIVAFHIRELEPSIGTWTKIATRFIDMDAGINPGDLVTMLDSPVILTPDKHDLKVDTGRAYIYAISLPTNLQLHVLDIFMNTSDDTIIRITVSSKQLMAKSMHPRLERILAFLGHALKRAQAGKFNTDMLESIIDTHLPVQLATPRHVTPGDIIDFTRETRSDPQLVHEDISQISNDMRKMDEASARRVARRYKDALDRDEMSNDDPGNAER